MGKTFKDQKKWAAKRENEKNERHKPRPEKRPEVKNDDWQFERVRPDALLLGGIFEE